MRRVKINALNMRVFGSDQIKGHSKATPNIYQLLKVSKAFVELEDVLNKNSGLV